MARWLLKTDLLRKFVAPEVVFGPESRKLAGKYARNLGAKKVLIITDAGIIAAGWVKDVAIALEEAGVFYCVFSGISPNPRSREVMLGAEFYRENGCDAIVAVGGGSPMDCAKGVGIVSSNNKDILAFEGIDKIKVPSPPLIFIPTTAGTSSDVSQFSIILNEEQRTKIAIISKAIVPDAALVDYQTTTTMSPYLTACTALDALVHAAEAFVSKAASPLTDIHALEAIRLISRNLTPAIAHPENEKYKNMLMLASLEAGFAFSNAILGAVHSMAHSAGGFLDLAHGECNAMLFEHVINFNYDSAPERYSAIASAMGIDTTALPTAAAKTALFERIKELKKSAGITKTLTAAGVSSADIKTLAHNACNDPCLFTNPKPASERDIEVIYEEAM